jgi:hypothetical protein
LPVFIGGSGRVAPGIRPEPHFAVQIDTTLHRSEIRVSHGFQRFASSFSRTAVTLGMNLSGADPAAPQLRLENTMGVKMCQ